MASGMLTPTLVAKGKIIGMAIANTPQLDPVAKEMSAMVKNVMTGNSNGVIKGAILAMTKLGNPN